MMISDVRKLVKFAFVE